MTSFGRLAYFLRRTWRLARLSPTRGRTLIGLWASRVSRRAGEWPRPYLVGNTMLWSRSIDTVGIEETFLAGEYDSVAPLLRTRHAPTVLDLGANVGAFAAFVFGVCPSARVLSVEPSPDTCALLERSRRANPTVDWSVMQAAVWTEPGTVTFASSGLSTGRRVEPTARGTTVPAVTLVSLVEQATAHDARVALLKADIEGAEGAVLEQAASLLDRVDALVVEVHPPRSNEAAVRRLLADAFPVVETVSGRRSAKPVFIAHRGAVEPAP